MGLIPIVIKPYPDELLYSWVFRLSKVNGLKPHSFAKAYMEDPRGIAGTLPYDIRRWFVSLYQNLNLNMDMSELYLRMTTYQYESFAMTNWQQMRYINNVFYKRDKLNPAVNPLFNTINVCPECIKEDVNQYGEAYFHRAHQLSGVCVCHKHGAQLIKYAGKPGYEIDYDLSHYEPFLLDGDIEQMIRCSSFAFDLLNSGMRTNLSIINKHLPGEKVDQYNSTTGDILEKLFLLCDGDVEKLRTVIQDELFNVPAGFELISSAELPIQTYRHLDCGNIFSSTNYGLNNGWKCPYCTHRATFDERFKEIINDTGKGRYSPLQGFKSIDSKVRLLHLDCGKDISIRARSFIFEGARCRCENTITKAEASRKISSLGDFELLDYDKTESPCRIRSNSCNHSFLTRYQKFINSPYCRVCNPKNMTTELMKEKISKMHNGEYELICDFVSQDKKIQILHKPCGEILECYPRHFTESTQCPVCGNSYAESWSNMYDLLCKYKAEFGTTDIPKRMKYKGQNLGIWCQHQRDDFKSHELSEYRTNKLNEIGFSFAPLDAEWNRRFEQYKRYVKEFNTTYISRRTDFEGEHLGAWLETQKKCYRDGKLNKERLLKLISIDENFAITDNVKDNQ